MMELTLLSLSLLSAGFVSLISVLLLFVWNRKRKQRLNAFRKCVLITGCDSGIGLNLATHLYNLGFTVFSGCLSLDSDGAKLLADDESYTKERMHVIRLDVTKTEAIREARTYIGDFLGRHLDHGEWELEFTVQCHNALGVAVIEF
ncbi:Estradiol 17-beta-dehydrogenase 2 [Halotydeus destructor]|nr:Estradiol 17-beta-dehydrogenase 2 [Halotydeus destructor]